MDMALYASLVSFTVVMSITPGPNNLMLMSSGALFGVRRTIPHWLGVNVGFSVLMIAAIFGLGELVERFPSSLIIVKLGGGLWLAWMATIFIRSGLKPVTAVQTTEAPHQSRPMHLHEAALFQWVNPKALLMAVSAAGAYIALAGTMSERAFIIVLTFIAFGAPCGFLWMCAGGVIKPYMSSGRSSQILNIVMGAILLATSAIIAFG